MRKFNAFRRTFNPPHRESSLRSGCFRFRYHNIVSRCRIRPRQISPVPVGAAPAEDCRRANSEQRASAEQHPISAGCARTAPERAADAPHSSHVCIPRPAQVSSTANSGPACLPRERPRQAHAHADRMTEAPGNQATQKHKKDGLRKIGDRPCVASSGPQNPVWPHYLFSSASAAFAGSSAGPAVTLPNAAMA